MNEHETLLRVRSLVASWTGRYFQDLDTSRYQIPDTAKIVIDILESIEEIVERQGGKHLSEEQRSAFVSQKLWELYDATDDMMFMMGFRRINK